MFFKYGVCHNIMSTLSFQKNRRLNLHDFQIYSSMGHVFGVASKNVKPNNDARYGFLCCVMGHNSYQKVFGFSSGIPASTVLVSISC